MDDTTIPFAAAEATCQQTQAVGNVCEMKAYQSGGHPPGFLAANRDEILQLSSEFLCRRVLAPHACDPPDIAAPITTDDVPAGFQNHPVSVTLSATDTGGSGLDKTYYTTGTSPPTPTTSSAVYSAASKPTLANGERIRYFSTDHAGNAEAVKSSPAAKVDTAAPSTTDDVPAGLQNRPATVTLSATDTGGSGLDKTYYTTGANPPDPTASSAVYNGAAKPTLADGERIKYFSTDRAGNAEAVKSSPAAKVGSAGPDEITTLEQPATQPVAFLEGTLAATRKGVVKFSLVNPNSFAVTEAVKIMTASPVALPLGAARKHKTKRVLTLGADRLSIPAGQRMSVKIRLSKSGRKLLARKGRLALRLGLSTQGPKGGPVASSRTVRPKVK
jgi:hypothetical protein